MSLSLANFRARFREFDQVPDATVQSRIDEAEARWSRTVLDASATYPQGDRVVGYEAAGMLREMQGEHAVGGAGSSKRFFDEARRLALACSRAARIVPGENDT